MPASPATKVTLVKYAMPTPAPMVVWRPSPGGEANFAIVTKVGVSAISLMVFPPESRVGVPKEAVRHVNDPMLKSNAVGDGGIWDFTEETKLLQALYGHTYPPDSK